MSSEPSHSDSSFHEVVDTVPYLVVVTRDDRSICYFNAAAATLTGFEPQKVLGTELHETLFPDVPVEEFESQLQSLLAGEQTRSETRIQQSSGEHSWLYWTARRLSSFQGQPGILLVGQDLSQSPRAAEAVELSEARLRAVLETAVDGIITINARGTIQSVNASAERIFKYSASDIVGRNVSILMPAPYREEHDSYLQNYLKTGEPKIIGIGREVVGIRSDGSQFPMDLAVSEISVGERMFTGVVRDLSERKRAEQQLLQSERLAAIGQMIAGLAHESRNAFQRSQACLEMLALDLETMPQSLELLNRVQRALDHLHHLYEEVRDYAAPMNLRQTPCFLPDIWRTTWKHLEMVRGEKQTDLVESIGQGDLTCLADPDALEQLFRNILENALAATDKDGRIQIHAEDQSGPDGDYVEVRVSDNGPGFEPEAQRRIFEPFFTTKTKGTGLGMAIVKRIVEAQRGTISAGNVEGGAEVVLRLPKAPASG